MKIMRAQTRLYNEGVDRLLEEARRHEHGHEVRPRQILQGRSDVLAEISVSSMLIVSLKKWVDRCV